MLFKGTNETTNYFFSDFSRGVCFANHRRHKQPLILIVGENWLILSFYVIFSSSRFKTYIVLTSQFVKGKGLCIHNIYIRAGTIC